MQCEFSPKSKVTKTLLEDNALFSAALGLLDSNASIVKGRVYLFINFVLSGNLKKSIILLDSKIFQIIERQGKDGAKY